MCVKSRVQEGDVREDGPIYGAARDSEAGQTKRRVIGGGAMPNQEGR